MSFESKKFTPLRPQQHWRDEGETKPKKPLKLWKLLTILIVILLIIIGLFTYVLPIAEVTIVPATTTHTLTQEIKIDSGIKKWNEVNSSLPGIVISKEKSAQGNFEATGEKDMGDKASGQATFYNETGLTQPITTHTELQAPNGKIFLAKQNFVIPQATVSSEGGIIKGEITVDIEAVEPGEEGNLDSGKLTIVALTPDRQGKLYGQITNPLTGGTSDIVQVVSQEDIDLAQEELAEQLKTEIIDEIRNSISRHEKIDEKLINWNILSSEKSVELDKETQIFDMRIVLEGKALIYNYDELETIIKEKIATQIGPNNKIVDSANNKIELNIDQFDQASTWAHAKLNAEFQIAHEINLDELKKQIAGKKRAEARRLLLQHTEIRDVRFNYKYSLIDIVPRHENRIKIFLKS